MCSNGVGFFNKIYKFIENTFKLNLRENNIEEELVQSFQQIVVSKGYKLEEYTVLTEDGYHLQLFRIHGYVNERDNIDIDNINKQAIYFQHGFLDSSDGWVCNYEKYCIPFIMCKKGFDVVSIFFF